MAGVVLVGARRAWHTPRGSRSGACVGMVDVKQCKTLTGASSGRQRSSCMRCAREKTAMVLAPQASPTGHQHAEHAYHATVARARGRTRHDPLPCRARRDLLCTHTFPVRCFGLVGPCRAGRARTQLGRPCAREPLPGAAPWLLKAHRAKMVVVWLVRSWLAGRARSCGGGVAASRRNVVADAAGRVRQTALLLVLLVWAGRRQVFALGA